MRTVCMSMWYGDAGKHLADRATHLLGKQGVSRWVWSCRPHNDMTIEMLKSVAVRGRRFVEVIVEEIAQPAERLPRLSAAADNMLLSLTPRDELLLFHESDLRTLADIVPRLHETMKATGAAVVGGWPMLSHHPDYPELSLRVPEPSRLEEPFFYDTWGYRFNGQRFGNYPPYSDCYKADEPFQLDSVGSVAIIDVEYIRRGACFGSNGFVELCERVRSLGGTVWCDPRVPVVQPLELWRINND